MSRPTLSPSWPVLLVRSNRNEYLSINWKRDAQIILTQPHPISDLNKSNYIALVVSVLQQENVVYAERVNELPVLGLIIRYVDAQVALVRIVALETCFCFFCWLEKCVCIFRVVIWLYFVVKVDMLVLDQLTVELLRLFFVYARIGDHLRFGHVETVHVLVV